MSNEDVYFMMGWYDGRNNPYASYPHDHGKEYEEGWVVGRDSALEN